MRKLKDKKFWKSLFLKKWYIKLFVFVVTGVTIFNIIEYKEKFFLNIKIYEIFTIILGFIFAYYLTQKENKLSVLKTQYVCIIDKLLSNLNSYNIYIRDFGKINKKLRLSEMRIITNEISVLQTHARKFDVEDELSFINNKWKAYKEIVSEEVEDIVGQEDKLKNIIELIINKLDEIKLKIFTY